MLDVVSNSFHKDVFILDLTIEAIHFLFVFVFILILSLRWNEKLVPPL